MKPELFFKYIYLMVENILRSPFPVSRWSAQGLGMLRVYLSDEVRLHIWDSALKVPGASALHTHPWDLYSTVIAGVYRQHRYLEDTLYGEPFQFVEIKCGEGACTMADPQSVLLFEQGIEKYTSGYAYEQSSDEIHCSCPEDGTVTVVKRTFKEDRDHAKVYWRGKGGWVDAKPRPATQDEITSVCERALRTWF